MTNISSHSIQEPLRFCACLTKSHLLILMYCDILLKVLLFCMKKWTFDIPSVDPDLKYTHLQVCRISNFCHIQTISFFCFMELNGIITVCAKERS